MKVIFELGLEEKITNIGVAKALTEAEQLSVNDLNEISQYIQVYCNAESIKELSYCKDEQALKGGVKE